MAHTKETIEVPAANARHQLRIRCSHGFRHPVLHGLLRLLFTEARIREDQCAEEHERRGRERTESVVKSSLMFCFWLLELLRQLGEAMEHTTIQQTAPRIR